MRGGVALLLLCLGLLLAPGSGAADLRLYTVSVPDLPVEPGERLAGVSLRMTGARLHSFREIPVGWIWQVGNHGSLITEVDGIAEVGAAGLDAEFVDGLFVIEQRDGPELPLKVEMVLRVTRDFSAMRAVTLGVPQLALEPR